MIVKTHSYSRESSRATFSFQRLSIMYEVMEEDSRCSSYLRFASMQEYVTFGDKEDTLCIHRQINVIFDKPGRTTKTTWSIREEAF